MPVIDDVRAYYETKSRDAVRRDESRRRPGRSARSGLEASLLDLPSEVPTAELAFSIEAFVHGPAPRAYFEAASRYLVPGRALAVRDDFRTSTGRATPQRRRSRA
ncbi:MAG TPA: hypothetical protein VFZ53_29770 [Polyangiaceae bacterium]